MPRDSPKTLPIWNDLPTVRAPEPPEARRLRLDRREFLTLLGVGGAATLAACQRVPVKKAIPHLVPLEDVRPGTSIHYATTCTACPAACGVLAVVRDGRPVKLEGHPDHPRSRGGLCAVGQGDLRAVYDPDRLDGPTLAGQVTTWRSLDEAASTAFGKARGGLWVLTPTVHGPTARRAVEDFVGWHGGRWLELDADAESLEVVREAQARLTGVAHVPDLDLAETDLLLTVGADPLGTGTDPVARTRAWSERRADSDRVPARLVALEGTMSLTGAASDERHAMTAAERRVALEYLLIRVAGHRDHPARGRTLPEVSHPEMLDALAEALRDAAPRVVVLCGDDDLEAQLLTGLLNDALGAPGVTLRPVTAALHRGGDRTAREAFLAELSAGRVQALVLMDVDPVGTLPGGAALAEAIAAVPFSVHIGTRSTLTSPHCKAVAPAHHGLEDWGDHAPTGTVWSLQQPALRPLFDTRPRYENLLHWTGSKTVKWSEHLRSAVMATRGLDAAGWHAALARGFAELERPEEDESPTPVSAASVLSALTTAAAAPELSAELMADVGLRDGHLAHVPWLRELPDPLTRASWMPCLRIAPARAKTLGVEDGDLLEVKAASGQVTLPVRVMPGQHPDVIGIPVGYGRARSDVDTPDHNAWHLLAATDPRRGLAVEVRRTGESVALPLMQWHGETEGRPIIHQVPTRDAHVPKTHHGPERGLTPEREQVGPKWEMVIDLDACTGCSACVVACQAENNLPVVGPDEMRRHRDMYWLRIDRYYVGDHEDPAVLFQPMMCSQCDNAPCETVCPVAATVHSADGLNQQAYNRCVGTRYCANNCPYKARRFNWFDHEISDPVERMVLNPDVVYRERGVMEKCTFCVQRIQRSRIEARAAGEDTWAPQTACQQTCPANAIRFGDANDPDSEVSRLKAAGRAFQVLAEIGVGPGVTYLARVRKGETTTKEHS